MIVTFKSKALKALFMTGRSAKLPQERVQKLKDILSVMHAAIDVNDVRIPGLRLHVLKAPPYRGFHSLDVTANYRLVFRFDSGKIDDVDYVDTH
jgi:toxin HigB-1